MQSPACLFGIKMAAGFPRVPKLFNGPGAAVGAGAGGLIRQMRPAKPAVPPVNPAWLADAAPATPKMAADLHPSMMFEDDRPDRPQLRKEQIEPTTLYGNEALDYVKKRFQRTKLHGRGTTAK